MIKTITQANKPKSPSQRTQKYDTTPEPHPDTRIDSKTMMKPRRQTHPYPPSHTPLHQPIDPEYPQVLQWIHPSVTTQVMKKGGPISNQTTINPHRIE